MENTTIENLYTNLEFTEILRRVAGYSFTPLGKETIKRSTIEKDKEAVEKYHFLISVLRKHIQDKGRLPNCTCINIDVLLENISKGYVTLPEELYDLSVTVDYYFTLKKRFKEDADELRQLFSVAPLNDPFYKDVLKFIRPDGYIEDKASKELGRIRKSKGNVEAAISRETSRFLQEAQSSRYTADDMIVLRDDFKCIPVKTNYKNKVKGVVIDTSSTGQTVFVVPQKVMELKNELVILDEKEKLEIRRILRTFCDRIGQVAFELEVVDKELTYFDILHAKTSFALRNEYESPSFVSSQVIKVIEGRHPIIGPDAVPLNIELGASFNTLIITGPNTGGKTVALKTLGLFVLMVQTGIPIPASSSSCFGLFDAVYVDIGDDQSIEESLSTFSGHIKKIKHITSNATSRSLILLDELGGGTDPIEGAALAIAIIKYLRDLCSLVVITTHSSALKNFASQEDDIENGSMEFNKESLSPTYNLLIGIPGSSRALEISSRLGIRKSIINEARGLLDGSYVDTEKIAQKMQEEKRALEEAKKRVLELETSLSEKEAFYIEEVKKLKQQQKEQKLALETEKSLFLKNARGELEHTIKKIKEKRASRDSIKKSKDFLTKVEDNLQNTRKEIEKLQKELKTEEPAYKKSSGPIEEGDYVIMKSNNTEGQVTSIDRKKKIYIVQFGSLKLNCKEDQIQKVKKKKKSNIIGSLPTFKSSPGAVKMELDLRGTRYEEADRKTDEFVNNAMLAKVSQVKIIHGKGTGAIRKCIHDYLKKSPFVEDFYFEKLGENQVNYGVTVVRILTK